MALGLGVTPLKETVGRPVRVTADGNPEWKPIGVTIAWGLVMAAVSDTTLSDGTPVYAGEKAIEFGTTLVKMTGGTYSGLYAPFDSTGSNGQATLTRGDLGIVDMSIKQSEKEADHTGLITGGLVWKQRLKVGGAGQPTLANLLAALPRLETTPNE